MERVESGIWRYFTQNLNFDELVLKSHRIYLEFCSRVNIWKCLQWIWHHYFDITNLKYKFGQIGPKIKASLNLHEYSRTRQFEDSKCKYDNKSMDWFLYDNGLRRERVKCKFDKMFVQYSASGRSVSEFPFLLNWPLLMTNLAFNLKIFEEILFHLHGKYK